MPLPSCICVAGRPPFDRLGDIYCALAEGEPPCGIPTIVSSQINGTIWSITFSEPVTGIDLTNIGLTGSTTGEFTPTFVSGEGTTVYNFTVDPAAVEGETVLLDVSGGVIAIENLCGNPLEPVEDFPVTNNTGLQFIYLRPGGADTYLRPGGVDTYIRP